MTRGRRACSAGTDAPRRVERLLSDGTVVYVADPGRLGRWQYVSPQIEMLLGFSAEEWLADPRMWARQLHPADGPRASSRARVEELREATVRAEEYRLRHRDGRDVWVRDNAIAVRERDERLRWHGVMSDISGHKRLEAELERRVAQQAAVARLGEHALEAVPMGELMQEAVQTAAGLLGVEHSAVLELCSAEDCFLVPAATSVPRVSPDRLRSMRIPTGRGSQAGYTILSGGPIVVSDWEFETRFAPSPRGTGPRNRSALTLPIEGRAGPFGVFSVASRTATAFAESDIDFVRSLANVLADALERQAIEDEIRHRSLHDPLTRLPNRALFEDRLGQALAHLRRRGAQVGVLFLDLDGFKRINDSLGHPFGDQLLVQTASRLREAVRESDTVARFGGDEFTILLEDVSGEQEAIEVAQRITARFTPPFVLAASEHFVTASIGVALARTGQVAHDLLRDADAAMYRAKERGRARHELFDEVMRGQTIARLRVENDLRHAVEREQLRLAYQPIVSVTDHAIVGVEALLRWDHPTRGTIAPSDFIPIAEQAGLIDKMGRWVLHEACREAVRWHQRSHGTSPIRLAVNLSALQLSRPELPEMVAGVLGATGLEPSGLTLEITESAMVRDTAAVSPVLSRLRRLGVNLVLDDFGSGYSSVGYLVLMPLDALKIDRAFIGGLGTDPRDSALTEAIIAMAHALSLPVVAEGVETPSQLAELRRLGCDYAQGFYLSAPVAAEEICGMLGGRRSL